MSILIVNSKKALFFIWVRIFFTFYILMHCTLLVANSKVTPLKVLTMNSSHNGWIERLGETPDSIKKIQEIVTDGTEFKFTKGVNYLGILYSKPKKHYEVLQYTFTLNDQTIITYTEHQAIKNEENSQFTGFTFLENKKVIAVKITSSTKDVYKIDHMYWGDRSDDGEKVSSCKIYPNLLTLQCEKNRWVFDVQVASSGTSSWWCINSNDDSCGSYDENVSFGYFTKSKAPFIKLAFKDQMNSECHSVLPVKLPESCNDGCQFTYDHGVETRRCIKKSETMLNAGLVYEN